MGDTVDVTIPVEADAAAALERDTDRRAAVGRLVSLVLRPRPGVDPLLDAMDRLSAEAKARGLTPEIIEEELAAHRAERRR
jgi:hypothetical protein